MAKMMLDVAGLLVPELADAQPCSLGVIIAAGWIERLSSVVAILALLFFDEPSEGRFLVSIIYR
jgi:hypothetical protein